MRRAVILVTLLLLAVPPLAAQEWTAEQQEVVEWLTTFNETAYAGTADEFLAWIHPQFTGWSFAEEAPVEMATFADMVTGFFASVESIRFGTKPVSVQVLDDVAVAHTWYRQSITGGEAEGFYAGRWTIVLKKVDGDWKHLAWTWTEERVDPEKMKREKAEG